MVKTNADTEQTTDEINTLTADGKVWLLFVTHPSPSLARTPAGARTDVAASIIGDSLAVGERQSGSDAAASSVGDQAGGTDAGGVAQESEGEESFTYLVAGTQRKGSCLHRAHGCWRARQRRFSTWEMFQTVPQGGWDRFCQDCWPKEAPLDDEAESPCSASAASTSSSQGSSTPSGSPMASPR